MSYVTHLKNIFSRMENVSIVMRMKVILWLMGNVCTAEKRPVLSAPMEPAPNAVKNSTMSWLIKVVAYAKSPTV